MDKNIFYIGSMVMPDGNACTERIKSICAVNNRLGYHNIIIGLDYAKKKDVMKTKKKYDNIDSYSIHYPKNIYELFKRMCSIRDICKVIESYSGEKVLFFVEYESIAMKRLMVFCKKNNIKYIVDCEEWYEKSSLFFPANVVKDFDTWHRTNVLHPKAKNVVAISGAFYDKYKNTENNVVKLPVFIDTSNPKWALESNINKSIVKIVYVGNPGVNNSKERLDVVVNAFHLCKDIANITLDIVGIEQQFYDKHVGIQDDRIHVRGKKTHIECLYILAGSDFALIPRESTRKNNYGFPTKLSECFGCGTPVIATDTSDIKEYIVEGKNGYLLSECSVNHFVEVFDKISKLTIEERLEMKKYTKDNNKLVVENFLDPMRIFMEKLQ